MAVYISGRYWPFIIVFGYTLRDLTVNLLSNDLSTGLDRKSSVIQRIIIYVAMLIVAIFCSTVIEFIQKQHCSQGEVVTSGRHSVDILNPETQHALLAHITLVTAQLEARLSQHITQIQARYESGNLSQTGVPSRSVSIAEPEALCRTEGLSKTGVHFQPPRIPEIDLLLPDVWIAPRLSFPQALPETQDLLQSHDLPQTQVVFSSSYIPEPLVVAQIEKLLPVEDLPVIEVPLHSPDIPRLQVSPQAEDLPRGDLPQTEVPSQSPDISELQAFSQTEDLLVAEEIPGTEDEPPHTGDILELQDLFPRHNSTFQEGSATRRTRNVIELYIAPGKGKSTVRCFSEVKAWTDMKAVELSEIKVIKIYEGDLGARPKTQDPSSSPSGPLDPEVAPMFSEDLDY